MNLTAPNLPATSPNVIGIHVHLTPDEAYVLIGIISHELNVSTTAKARENFKFLLNKLCKEMGK